MHSLRLIQASWLLSSSAVLLFEPPTTGAVLLEPGDLLAMTGSAGDQPRKAGLGDGWRGRGEESRGGGWEEGGGGHRQLRFNSGAPTCSIHSFSIFPHREEMYTYLCYAFTGSNTSRGAALD